jgi:hypothetical protein
LTGDGHNAVGWLETPKDWKMEKTAATSLLTGKPVKEHPAGGGSSAMPRPKYEQLDKPLGGDDVRQLGMSMSWLTNSWREWQTGGNDTQDLRDMAIHAAEVARVAALMAKNKGDKMASTTKVRVPRSMIRKAQQTPQGAPQATPAGQAPQAGQAQPPNPNAQLVGKQVQVFYASGPVTDVIKKAEGEYMYTKNGLVMQIDKSTGRWTVINSSTGKGGGNLYAEVMAGTRRSTMTRQAQWEEQTPQAGQAPSQPTGQAQPQAAPSQPQGQAGQMTGKAVLDKVRAEMPAASEKALMARLEKGWTWPQIDDFAHSDGNRLSKSLASKYAPWNVPVPESTRKIWEEIEEPLVELGDMAWKAAIENLKRKYPSGIQRR